MEIEQLLGQELRRHRLLKGWSQEELAFEADVDRNYVSLIELGRNSSSIKVLARICSALDIRMSQVLLDVEAQMAPRVRRKAKE